MTTRRVVKSNNFSIVSNKIIRDTRLSLKARGLLILMLSLPDNWEFSIAGLSTTSGEGKDSIRAGVKELESAGYLTRQRKHLSNGKLAEMEYTIYEEPIETTREEATQDSPTKEEPTSEKPTQENTVQEKTAQGNPTEINKEYKQVLNIASTERERENINVLQGATYPQYSLLGDGRPLTCEQLKMQGSYFNRFWNLYPRRMNKCKASLAWNALPVDEALYSSILLAVERCNKSRQWQDKLYVPYPETFINERRWEDDVPDNQPRQLAKKNDVAGAVSNVIARLEAMGDD